MRTAAAEVVHNTKGGGAGEKQVQHMDFTLAHLPKWGTTRDG